MAIDLTEPRPVIEPAKTIGHVNRFQVPSFTFVDVDGQEPYAEIGCQGVFVTRDEEGAETGIQPVHNFTVRVEGADLAPFAGLIESVKATIYTYLTANGHFPEAE